MKGIFFVEMVVAQAVVCVGPPCGAAWVCLWWRERLREPGALTRSVVKLPPASEQDLAWHGMTRGPYRYFIH